MRHALARLRSEAELPQELPPDLIELARLSADPRRELTGLADAWLVAGEVFWDRFQVVAERTLQDTSACWDVVKAARVRLRGHAARASELFRNACESEVARAAGIDEERGLRAVSRTLERQWLDPGELGYTLRTSVDPQLYASDHRHLLVSGRLGPPQADGFPTVTGNGGVFDLARNPSNGQAILVEPAFYNNFVNRGLGYAQARQLTEDYYQEIVLTDVLPAYVGQSTINEYLTFGANGAAHVNTPNLPSANFSPIEFSVGAYRFGHSLVRDNYHINDIFPTATDIDDNVSIFDINAYQTGDLSAAPHSRARTAPVQRRAPRPRCATSRIRPATRSSGSTSCRNSTPTRTIPGSTSLARRSRRSAPRCSTCRRRRSSAVPTSPIRCVTAPAP